MCLLVRGDPPTEILLGLKKAGFGAGKYNGFGGKVEVGETIESAAIREVAEEVGLIVPEEDLQPVGRLTFLFSANPAWDRVTYVFMVAGWEGEPRESVEMRPVWFAVDDIPFERMWQGDVYWMPRILAGERVRGCVTFGEDNETVAAWRVETEDQVYPAVWPGPADQAGNAGLG